MRPIMFAIVLGCLVISSARADDSGPKVGDVPKELKVAAVTGDSAGKEIDFVADRAKKPTIYLFVRADAFDRPMARFIRTLDKDSGEIEDAAIVAVWLTEDVDKSKEYLAKVDKSLKLGRTTLAVYPKDAAGPAEWKVNADSRITAVVLKGSKVVKSEGFASLNETDAAGVIKALGKTN